MSHASPHKPSSRHILGLEYVNVGLNSNNRTTEHYVGLRETEHC